MKTDIPIIITKNAHKGGIYGFKLASPELLRQLNFYKGSNSLNPRLTIQTNKHHQTISTNSQIASRTRRISSSAAAKRFPKDFFKDQNCFHPIKSLKLQHKKQDQSFIECCKNKNKLIYSQAIKEKDQAQKGTQTPNFKQRAQMSVGNKTDVTDYVMIQLSNCQQTKKGKEISINQKSLKKQTILQIRPLQQSLNQPLNVISNFNLTLGQKISHALIIKKQNRDKRKKVFWEKQNSLEYKEEGRSKTKSPKGELGFRIRRKV